MPRHETYSPLCNDRKGERPLPRGVNSERPFTPCCSPPAGGYRLLRLAVALTAGVRSASAWKWSRSFCA
jgi:hypothetical protein